MIVVDASALTDLLLGRPEAVGAVRDALAGNEHQPLHAPDLIEPETLNALRRLASSGAVTDLRADEAVSDFALVRLIRYPHAPFRERVWALRHNLTAYDATYLALAEALDDATLLTGDRGLASYAAESLGPTQVHLVE